MALAIFNRRRIPKASRKPCPLCEGELMDQAWQLFRAGYYLGAIATARCELDARLRIVAQMCARKRGDNVRLRSTSRIVDYLRSIQVIDRDLMHRIRKVNRRAGNMVHTYASCNCIRSQWAIREFESIVVDLHRFLMAEPVAE